MKHRIAPVLLVAGLAVLAAGCGEEAAAPPTTTVGDLFRNSAATPTVPPLEVVGWEDMVLTDARKAAEACVLDARPEEIVLPDEGPETVTVESGDTLGNIAERFDSTVDAFMRANALSDPNRLRVGQVLLIPRERDDDTEVESGPSIDMEELVCVIDTGVEAHGPDGAPVGRNGVIEVLVRWPRIEGPYEAPKVNGRMLGLTQGAVAAFLDDSIGAVEGNGYACREVFDGRCMWLQHDHEVMLATDELLSLRNIVRTLVPGAAGETAATLTETFDLTTGAPIVVADLFDPETAWVEAVSAEAVTRLEPEPWVDERRTVGAGPDAVNFERFNLTQGGLVLSFAPFTVGGSGSNTASITIPYRSLEGYWAPGGHVEALIDRLG